MVSAKPAQGAEPVQCSGAAKIKPPFEMGVDNFDPELLPAAFPTPGRDIPDSDHYGKNCNRLKKMQNKLLRSLKHSFFHD